MSSIDDQTLKKIWEIYKNFFKKLWKLYIFCTFLIFTKTLILRALPSTCSVWVQGERGGEGSVCTGKRMWRLREWSIVEHLLVEWIQVALFSLLSSLHVGSVNVASKKNACHSQDRQVRSDRLPSGKNIAFSSVIGQQVALVISIGPTPSKPEEEKYFKLA